MLVSKSGGYSRWDKLGFISDILKWEKRKIGKFLLDISYRNVRIEGIVNSVMCCCNIINDNLGINCIDY